METKIIMRYKREKPAWICWNCEMENEVSVHECYFCRAKRDNARVVKSWAEEAALSSHVEKPAEIRKYIPKEKLPDDSRVDETENMPDEELYEQEDSVLGPVIIWTVLLIVIVLIVMVASS